MRLALDTNVLVYAEGLNDANRRTAALEVVSRLPPSDVWIPIQVLGELFTVLVRKARRDRHAARDIVLTWRDTYGTVDTTTDVLLGATDLVVDHRLPVWDSIILAAAAVAGCRLLLSEDLADGFTWRGVTVVDPFRAARHPLLAGVIGEN